MIRVMVSGNTARATANKKTTTIEFLGFVVDGIVVEVAVVEKIIDSSIQRSRCGLQE